MNDTAIILPATDAQSADVTAKRGRKSETRDQRVDRLQLALAEAKARAKPRAIVAAFIASARSRATSRFAWQSVACPIVMMSARDSGRLRVRRIGRLLAPF